VIDVGLDGCGECVDDPRGIEGHQGIENGLESD